MKIRATAALVAAIVLAGLGPLSEANAATKTFTNVSIGNEAKFERPAQTVANAYCKGVVNGTAYSFRYLGWHISRYNGEPTYYFSAIVCQY